MYSTVGFDFSNKPPFPSRQLSVTVQASPSVVVSTMSPGYVMHGDHDWTKHKPYSNLPYTVTVPCCTGLPFLYRKLGASWGRPTVPPHHHSLPRMYEHR